MIDIFILFLAAFASVALLNFFRPLLLPLILMLFDNVVTDTARALGKDGKEEESSFELFSAESKAFMEPLRQSFEALGFRPLIDYKNPTLEKVGGESFTSAWLDPSGEVVACVTSIVTGRVMRFAGLFGGPCFPSLGKRLNAVLIESTSTSGERLFTYCAEDPLPEMPVRYRIKSLEPGTPVERVLEVHLKRLLKWRSTLTNPVISYDTSDTFLVEQAKQREELARFIS